MTGLPQIKRTVTEHPGDRTVTLAGVAGSALFLAATVGLGGVRRRHARALLLAALASAALGCGSGSDSSRRDGRETERSEAPRYAATPRAVLESWVTAVRRGDLDGMCRIIHLRAGCSAPMLNEQLPKIRAEMRGLRGELRYGAVNIGRGHTLIGVVSGDSPFAYAVAVSRGSRQWGVRPEAGGDRRVQLNQPDAGAILARGPTEVSFTVWSSGSSPGNSGYRYPDVWINGRPMEGRLRGEAYERFVSRARWTGVARLAPGRNMMVVAIRGYPIAAWAWVLTAR